MENIKSAEELLSTIYLQLEDNRKALEHYKQYIVVRDSLINKENTKKIMQAEIDYTVEKNETKIKLLQKDKELQLA